MNIKIKSLSLTNFKCFASKEITFDGAITTIMGRNGEGKTTIADAILFCLFGKDTHGNSDLNIFKTINKETKMPIPHLDHSVELVLDIDGRDVTLKRAIKEDWIKKRGGTEMVFKNNSQEFTINGDDTTPTEYKKYIESLVQEKTFRAITNPMDFVNWHWKEQREFLTAMAGSVVPEMVVDTEELKELVDEVFDKQGEDIETYIKHIRAKIKTVKEKLERIPIRLEEQNKALPETMEWDNAESKLDALKKELADLQAKIAEVKQGNGAEIKRNEIRQSIAETRKAIDSMRLEATSKYNEANIAHNKKVHDYSVKFSSAVNDQRLMELTISADERLIERCGETDFEAELQKLRDQWPSNQLEIDPSLRLCPTCGQPIPDFMYEEKVAEIKRKFTAEREEKIKSLNEQAAKIKQQQQDAKNELENLNKKLTEDKAKLDAIKKSINEIFAEKAEVEKEPVKTAEEYLAENLQYAELTGKLKEQEASLENIVDGGIDESMLSGLTTKKTEVDANIEACMSMIASKKMYDKVQGLIDGIKKEEKELVRLLSELEKKEDVARTYQNKQNTILESRINERFKLVQWKLFETVNNGGDSFEKDACECYVDGIPYHSNLNDAARLNAGLDICEAISKHFNFFAPIVIDNAESCLNIYQTTGQQIRLYVNDTDLKLV